MYITRHDALLYVLNAGHKPETDIMLSTINNHYFLFNMHFITSTMLLRTFNIIHALINKTYKSSKFKYSPWDPYISLAYSPKCVCFGPFGSRSGPGIDGSGLRIQSTRVLTSLLDRW